jgi:hypothetical protein
LAIRTVLTAFPRAFFRDQTDPFEGILDILFRAMDIADLISILDSQDEGAAMLLCKKVVEQGGADSTDM